MKKIWKVMPVLFIVLFAGMLVTGCSKPDQKQEVVNIVGNLPLSGPVASWSGQYPNGFNMGIEESSAKLDVSPDLFKVDFQDNAGTPQTGVTVAQKQLLNPIQVYISGTSNVSNAILSSLDKKEIPHFLATFDAYQTQEGKARLRVMPNFLLEGPMFVDYAKKHNAKRVFMITLNISSNDEEFASIVEPGLKAAGIDFQRERFEFGTKDYRTFAIKAAAYKPDLVIISGFAFHIYPIVSALRTNGLIKDGNVLSTLDLIDLLHSDTPRSEFAGIAFISPLFEIPGAINGADKWRERFKEKFGKSPSYVDAYAYDTAGIIVAAQAAKGEVTLESMLSVFPYDGITGNVQLDKDRNLVSTLTFAKVNGKGEIVQAQ